MSIAAASYFKDNSEIIAACFRLGYLDRNMKVIDPTYGQGNWWSGMKPKKLVKHDLILDGVDFRNVPHRANSFDAAGYDPPYVSVGGRATTTIKEMYDAYGLTGAPTSPKKLQALMDAGLREMVRVVKPGGIILMKSMNYVSSGKLWPGTYLVYEYAEALGLFLEDEFLHIKKKAGPQPKGRTRKCKECGGYGGFANPRRHGPRSILCEACEGRGVIPSEQQHARRNVTTLHVWRVPNKK